MAGFGSPKSDKKKKKNIQQITPKNNGNTLFNNAVNYHAKGDLENAEKYYREAINTGLSIAALYSNLGVICQGSQRTEEAIALYQKAIKINPKDPYAYTNSGSLYKDLGNLDQALSATLKSLQLKPDNPDALNNLGAIYTELDNLDQALSATLKSVQLNPDNHTAQMNLGGIYKDLGKLDHALAATLKSVQLNPDNHTAQMNLGGIYKDLGKLDHALAATLKSLQLKPDNPGAHRNLGWIYKELGYLDQALSSTLKSLELKGNNPYAIRNLKDLIEILNLSASNAKNLTQAYELLLKQTDVRHQKLSNIFIHTFLPIIRKASISDPIISEENQALKILTDDWRFIKSLTLMIPPSEEVEEFFTRLREELLTLTIQRGTIPDQFKPLTEALATQCFLNEYVYRSSQEEEYLITKLIDAAVQSQEATNKRLAIIGCYKAIYKTRICPKLIKNYPTLDYTSRELITTQFKDPNQEQEIKASLHEKQDITETISKKVQEMYEENPYPRFKFSDYTDSKLKIPIFKYIEAETTKKDLTFLEELKSPAATPKVLIAGCGTGNQVIMASRYKNAQITAIDLSGSSLAYAIRKTREYGMVNTTFKKMDLLNVAELGEIFDIVECSGVLHHMDKPSSGLSAVIQQLKSGGYIKIGLYSKIAREVIVEARKIIKKSGIGSTPEGIRRFRKLVLDREIKELLDLPKFVTDFYSLSECRDLCFHVQEHLFTTESLQKLLDSHCLSFCGFMLPDQIKKLYQERCPEDNDMTSLSNWGEFEEKNPSTFSGMYQFWAQKIS